MKNSQTSLPFDELLGEQLSAVTFVQDYIQLWFDGPGINITNPLTVQTTQASVTSWADGFRDALCAQVSKRVTSVTIRENEEFAISFTDESRLLVSLRAEDYQGPEAIYAHGFRDNDFFVA